MDGFSLTEMMISVTVGLLIIAALTSVLISNIGSSKTNDRTAELQSNGRFAIEHLTRELRHAGFRGYTWADPTYPPTTMPAVNNECREDGAPSGSFIANLRQGIWGANDSFPFVNCPPGAARLRGDVLVIRHANGKRVLTLQDNTVYFRFSYAVGEVFQGLASAPPITKLPLADFAVEVYIYYIGLDGVTPALRRIALYPDGGMYDELVVSGIEEFQVQYGKLDTAGNMQYLDAASGGSSDSSATEWDDVISAKVWLLTRTSRKETGYADMNSYTMGDVTYQPSATDRGYRRQLFTGVVEMRN